MYCCVCILQCLRQAGVGNKIVEFFGSGVGQLSMSDRITIANMSPEYGAVAAFFPTDNLCLDYLEQSGNRLIFIYNFVD
jgi:aconitate hydratase